MGLRMLPRMITLAQWNARFFEAVAVALQQEESRLGPGQRVAAARHCDGRDMVPAFVESSSRLTAAHRAEMVD